MARPLCVLALAASLCLPGSLLEAFPQSQTPALRNADIVKMVAAGLGEAVILQSIKTSPYVVFDLTPEGLLALKDTGVSDALIEAMFARASDSPPGPERVESASIEIPDSTEIRVRLLTPISSSTARMEDPLRFEVVEDVVIEGHLIVAKGAEAKGRVTEAQKSRSFGRSGKLSFSIDSVRAVDGTALPVRSTREMKGDARVGGTVVAVALVGVFGGFVKGKNIDVPAGTEYSVFTSGERKIATPYAR